MYMSVCPQYRELFCQFYSDLYKLNRPYQFQTTWASIWFGLDRYYRIFPSLPSISIDSGIWSWSYLHLRDFSIDLEDVSLYIVMLTATSHSPDDNPSLVLWSSQSLLHYCFIFEITGHPPQHCNSLSSHCSEFKV